MNEGKGAGSGDIGNGCTTVYTIGHSNHEAGRFVALLQQHGIEVVVDVRSSPYSRYVPQANREALARTLGAAGIAYLWWGDRLGGKPDGEVADYDVLRVQPSFQAGIAALEPLAAERRAAIMCAEGDHSRCHRGKLITPELVARGLRVVHIQPDGSVVEEGARPQQLSLF